MKKEISVIIQAYNEGEYIKATLESYNRQRFKQEKIPYELIVVANGCKPGDDTANIANDLGARVLELEKANASIARNKGVDIACGELVIFNDADTLAAPNYLEAINNAFKRNYDFGCALFKPENYHPMSVLYSMLAWASGFVMRHAGGNMFVRRNLFDKTGGFDPELAIGEDTELSHRLKEEGGRYKFLHSTHVMTSLRKFRQNGYCKELFAHQVWPYVKDTLFRQKKQS